MVNGWVTLLLQRTLTTTRVEGVENPLWKPGDANCEECRGQQGVRLDVAPAKE